MTTIERTIPNLYRDSITLMQISARLADQAGVTKASAVMATESNLTLLQETGFLAQVPPASSNDLLVVVEGPDEAQLEVALSTVETLLNPAIDSHSTEGQNKAMRPRSIDMALETNPEANLVFIATPGEYAAPEAWKALRLGLHVMIFSDNVSLEAEIQLKHFAQAHNRLVMGPDCGTAIINGVPLGFANNVQTGSIGVIAASGTGLQQVVCWLDHYDQGISQAIGTGGRDLHPQVGGMTMMMGLQALSADPGTEIIILISKPPAKEVAQRIFWLASQTTKPVVINFLGADIQSQPENRIWVAKTLADAAETAVTLATGQGRDDHISQAIPADLTETLLTQLANRKPEQRYVRGLFSGGTFCYETQLLLQESVERIYSNTPLEAQNRVPDLWQSFEHTILDLGDDELTRGRPHPMIDPQLRNERLWQEMADPEVAIILFDIVLGYGAHPRPASEIAETISRARIANKDDGKHIVFIASVCGTKNDPQNMMHQIKRLRDLDVLVCKHSTQAALLTRLAMKHLKATA